MTGPSRQVRADVIARDSPDGWRVCQLCGRTILDYDYYSLQHRRARQGSVKGKKDQETNGPSNLVLVCGSATTECHGWIESHPTEAKALGFRIEQQQLPSEVLISTYSHGLCLLTTRGTVIRQGVPF